MMKPPEFTEIALKEEFGGVGTSVYRRAGNIYLGFVGKDENDKTWVFYPYAEEDDDYSVSAAVLANIAAYLQYLS